MERSSTRILEEELLLPDGPDHRSVKRWVILYAAYLAVLFGCIALLLGRLGDKWSALLLRPGEFTGYSGQLLKLLTFLAYISVATTFLPLPTNWLVAALATRDLALSSSVLTTMVLVASFGAAGSVIANLNDYYLFTLLLRHRRIARVRTTQLYQRTARWFSRRPFALVMVFNVLPIPIDFVRMLAATCRYPLRPYVAANFLGRWVRYAVLAAVTFELGPHGWIAVVALLATAIILGVGRLLPRGPRARPAPGSAARPGGTIESGKERQP